MQFKVPQNVQREDKIVGPLTLKQLLICGAGAITSYAIYVSLANTYIWITWLIPVSIVVIITIAFAFVRPLDLSFTKWILRWIEFSIRVKKRVWTKASGELSPAEMSTTKSQKNSKKKNKKDTDELDPEAEKQRNIENLQRFLKAEQNKQ